jgi:hypothetical protein
MIYFEWWCNNTEYISTKLMYKNVFQLQNVFVYGEVVGKRDAILMEPDKSIYSILFHFNIFNQYLHLKCWQLFAVWDLEYYMKSKKSNCNSSHILNGNSLKQLHACLLLQCSLVKPPPSVQSVVWRYNEFGEWRWTVAVTYL